MTNDGADSFASEAAAWRETMLHGKHLLEDRDEPAEVIAETTDRLAEILRKLQDRALDSLAPEAAQVKLQISALVQQHPQDFPADVQPNAVQLRAAVCREQAQQLLSGEDAAWLDQLGTLTLLRLTRLEVNDERRGPGRQLFEVGFAPAGDAVPDAPAWLNWEWANVELILRFRGLTPPLAIPPAVRGAVDDVRRRHRAIALALQQALTGDSSPTPPQPFVESAQLEIQCEEPEFPPAGSPDTPSSVLTVQYEFRLGMTGQVFRFHEPKAGHFTPLTD